MSYELFLHLYAFFFLFFHKAHKVIDKKNQKRENNS
jgi:hypothetical protein